MNSKTDKYNVARGVHLHKKMSDIHIVKDVAKISTNKLSTFDFSISTFISQHVSTLNRVLFR